MSEKKPVKVFLEGKLGKLFGRKWELFVNSPSEAIRAIDINTKGKLKEYLLNAGAKKYYKIALQKKDNFINPREEVKNPSGQSDIYFIPTIKGSSSGTGKIIAGAVLFVIGAILTVGSYGSLSSLGVPLMSAGIGLMLGGAVQLMTPVPKMAQPSAEPDLRQSNTFQGNAVNVYQGSSVGIVYGRALVSPMPVSLATENKDIGKWASFKYTPIEVVPLTPEQVQQYNYISNWQESMKHHG